WVLSPSLVRGNYQQNIRQRGRHAAAGCAHQESTSVLPGNGWIRAPAPANAHSPRLEPLSGAVLFQDCASGSVSKADAGASKLIFSHASDGFCGVQRGWLD